MYRSASMTRPGRLRQATVATIAAASLASVALVQHTSPAARAADSPSAAFPFRDASLPLTSRLDDLMSRLTLDEKIGLLHQYEQPIPRLGIGLFKAGTEALHGVAWSSDANNNG